MSEGILITLTLNVFNITVLIHDLTSMEMIGLKESGYVCRDHTVLSVK